MNRNEIENLCSVLELLFFYDRPTPIFRDKKKTRVDRFFLYFYFTDRPTGQNCLVKNPPSINWPRPYVSNWRATPEGGAKWKISLSLPCHILSFCCPIPHFFFICFFSHVHVYIFLKHLDWKLKGYSKIFSTIFIFGFPVDPTQDPKWNISLYSVACERGGVSNKPSWLRAATRHVPGTL